MAMGVGMLTHPCIIAGQRECTPHLVVARVHIIKTALWVSLPFERCIFCGFSRTLCPANMGLTQSTQYSFSTQVYPGLCKAPPTRISCQYCYIDHATTVHWFKLILTSFSSTSYNLEIKPSLGSPQCPSLGNRWQKSPFQVVRNRAYSALRPYT